MEDKMVTASKKTPKRTPFGEFLQNQLRSQFHLKEGDFARLLHLPLSYETELEWGLRPIPEDFYEKVIEQFPMHLKEEKELRKAINNTMMDMVVFPKKVSNEHKNQYVVSRFFWNDQEEIEFLSQKHHGKLKKEEKAVAFFEKIQKTLSQKLKNLSKEELFSSKFSFCYKEPLLELEIINMQYQLKEYLQLWIDSFSQISEEAVEILVDWQIVKINQAFENEEISFEISFEPRKRKIKKY